MIEELPRIPTHIPGLDEVLEGGFLSGGVYILEGPPGAGKTTLGSQFCFQHAAAGGRALYVTLLAEQHTRLLGHLRRMTFFDASLVPSRVSYVSAFKVLEAEGLSSVLKMVRHTIAEQKTTALVLDGLTSAEEASPTAKDFKKFIHELQIITSMTGVTALLLNSSERPGGFRPERTMVDGILELQDEVIRERAIRHLVVRKMRGAAQVRGRHYMQISDDGIAILPRIESGDEGQVGRVATGASALRVELGIEGIDAMLGGGLPNSSITAIVGPSGSGKTVLGLQFLHAGTSRGEPGLYFGFYERPPAILEKTRRLHIDVQPAVAAGHLELMWNRPVESVIDVLADSLLKTVRRQGTRRLFIDGLQGFYGASQTPDRLREVLSCLSDALESLGVTTVYSSETPDLFGENLQLSVLGMSAITHNILLLRHLERASQTIRLISVLKLRDSAHDASIREFRITDHGIDLADSDKGSKPRSRASKKAAPATKRTTQAAPKRNARNHRAR